MAVTSVYALPVLIEVKISEEDFLLTKDSVFEIIDIIEDAFIAVLTGIEANHITLQHFCSVRTSKRGNFID